MRMNHIKLLWICSLIIYFSVSINAQTSEPPTQGSGEILKQIGIDQHLEAQIPLDTPFVDEYGRDVKLKDYFGSRPVILAPVYYECPMLCTLALNGIVQSVVQMPLEAGKDYTVLAISFNPNETSELALAKKEAYVKRYGRSNSEDGWHFLTGKEENIKKIMDVVGFRYAWDPSMKQYAHAGGIMLLTSQGKVSRYFYGVEYPVKDLQAGIQDAALNRIGKPAEKVILYCFNYDPATGKYSLIALRAVKAGGIATMLVIGTFLFLMFRRERRSDRK